MKTSEVLLPAILVAIVLWWLLGPNVTATVDLGPNAKIGSKEVDTRADFVSPLATPAYQAPPNLAGTSDLDVGGLLSDPFGSI